MTRRQMAAVAASAGAVGGVVGVVVLLRWSWPGYAVLVAVAVVACVVTWRWL